jgi:hypothetical protein
MKQKITAENWEIPIQNERDMNIARTNFTKAFLDILELCIPKREVTIRSNDKIWFDSILRKEIRKRNRLRKKYLLIKNDSSKELYKRQRNLIIINYKLIIKRNRRKKSFMQMLMTT